MTSLDQNVTNLAAQLLKLDQPLVTNPSHDSAKQDISAINCRLLCHSIQLIEGSWQRSMQARSTGPDYQDGFSQHELNKAIQEAAHLAEHILREFDQIRVVRVDSASPQGPKRADGNEGRRR